MNRYEMEPILNPCGRFVIYGDHLNAIETLKSRVAKLEEGLRYAIKQVPELATVPGIAALNL